MFFPRFIKSFRNLFSKTELSISKSVKILSLLQANKSITLFPIATPTLFEIPFFEKIPKGKLYIEKSVLFGTSIHVFILLVLIRYQLNL